MTYKNSSPLQIIPRSIWLMLAGNTVYPQNRVDQIITLDDGRQYRIFREVIMRDNPPCADGGIFRVWFQTKRAVRRTILFSLLTKIGFIGMPGFRSKLWLINDDTEEFGGIYQFDTVENARQYQRSFAMQFSKWRSKPGCFATEVYEKVDESSLFRSQEKPFPSAPIMTQQYSRG